MSNAAFRELAQHIVELRRRVDGLSAPQLAHSSLEDASVNSYDADGQLSAILGRQYDGSHGAVAVAGPKPPTPIGVLVQPVLNGLRIGWGGEFVPLPAPEGSTVVTPVVAPVDWLRVEVVVATAPELLALQIPRSTIESPRGGEVVPAVSYDTDYYVALRVRTTSGRAGDFSEIVGPVRALKASVEDLDIDFEQLRGTKIFYGPDEPITDKADLWLKSPVAGSDVYTAWRYMPDLGDWVMLQDQGIVQALQDAAEANSAAAQAGVDALAAQGLAQEAGTAAGNAQTAAQQAKTAADNAASAASLAKSTADGKATVYAQTSAPTGLVAGDVNDLWIDTDESNKTYRWSGTAWVASDDARIASALNTANSKTTVFAQASAPSATGRTNGDVWIDTDDSNRWYDWTGSWTARQWGAGAISATARQLGAITTFRQASAPTTGMIAGDFWIDSDDNVIYRYQDATAGWVKSQDVNINTAIQNAATAQAVADGKMRIFVQPSAPTGLVAGDLGDMWIDTDDSNVTHTWSGTAWEKRQIGNGAIVPQSLIASDVIATGTVSAALLEAIMVLTNIVIAGDPLGDHARMTPTGFRVYKASVDAGEAPDEVVRMGTDTNDYFGIVNAAGQVVGSWDDNGRLVATGLNITGDALFNGQNLDKLMADRTAGAIVGQFRGGLVADVGPVVDEMGLIEVNAMLNNDHAYYIRWNMTWFSTNHPVEARVRVRSAPPSFDGSDQSTGAPTITSFEEDAWNIQAAPGGLWQTSEGETMIYPSRDGRHRFLLTIQRGAGSGGGTLTVKAGRRILLSIVDAGPRPANSGNESGGGGTLYTAPTAPAPPPPPPPPPPTQQYFRELAPNFQATYRGDGTLRTDVGAQVVQGWDPSGYNGDGYGFMTFPLPDIFGTVDRAELYLYTSHWYNNSGGTAILNVIKSGQAAGGNGQFGTLKLKGDHYVSGYQKQAGKTIVLPGDWWGLFRNAEGANRAIGIGFGASGGSNLTYYGKFEAPAARLRLWYTQ